MKTPLEILQRYWNHSTFRTPQSEIIEAVLARKNVIALLPTGGGKSVCFQVPALLLEGICIVISPLIALMQDQIEALSEKGIKATSIKSGSSQDEIITLFDNLQFAKYSFLYLSPERLQSPFIQEKVKQLNVSLIAIDEAHCISEWGHDFRPSYRNIKILKEIHPTTPCIALTATATKTVLNDIAENLNLQNPSIFKKSFYRHNLAYQFYHIEDKLGRLIQIFTKTKAPAIVYVKSRNKTKEIAAFLNANRFSAGYYHAGLSSEEKQDAFENWMLEKTPIMVATNAFGMGIDKDNVKVVVHLDVPNSIENYVQEAGRAGRNGEKSFSVVLYNQNDIRVYKEQNELQFPTIDEVKDVYKKLHLYYQIANGELIETAFEFDFAHFCNSYSLIPAKLNSILILLINNGIIQLTNDYNQKSTVQILASNTYIIKYTTAKNDTSTLIKILLRSYGGLFEQATKINEHWLSKKAEISIQKVYAILTQLHKDEIVEYTKTNSSSELFFLQPREDNIAINIVSKSIKSYINQKRIKSEELINFVENNSVCRSIQLLHYFDETSAKACGVCDVCLAKKQSVTTVKNSILIALKQHNTLSSKEIQAKIDVSEKDLLINLQYLLAEDFIGINEINKYYIK